MSFWASMDVPFHDASFVYCKLMWLSGTQKPTASFGYLLCCFKSFGESAVQANEQMRPDVKRGMTDGHVKLTGRTNTGHPMYYGTKIMVKQVRWGKVKGIDFRGRIESINCRGLVILLIGPPGQLVYAPLRPKQTNECICKLNVLFTSGSKKKTRHSCSPKEKAKKKIEPSHVFGAKRKRFHSTGPRMQEPAGLSQTCISHRRASQE